MAYDAAVIGGGIIGAASASMLAEEGASVVLLEREGIAAGASGRNSGALQQPFDLVLRELYRQSLPLYHQLAADDDGFVLDAQPAGLLLVAPDDGPAAAAAAQLRSDWPELVSGYLPADEARRLEPALAEGIGGCLLATGYPVAPATAARAYARRAERAGAAILVGAEARPLIDGGRVLGVELDGRRIEAGAVLVAAGPWSPALVPGWADEPPIRPTYGVLVSTRLSAPPRHVLEELGFDPGATPEPAFFSLVTADESSSVGSTFFDSPVSAEELRPAILSRGQRFVPELAGSPISGLRVCTRPMAFDGRPLIGPVAGVTGLFACAGHGPWGLSTGPASARLVVEQVLGRAPDETLAGPLSADRWPIRTPYGRARCGPLSAAGRAARRGPAR